MKEFTGEGGRGLGFGLVVEDKAAREKLKIKSDYLFPILNPIRASVKKNPFESDSRFRSKNPFESDSRFRSKIKHIPVNLTKEQSCPHTVKTKKLG